MYRKNMNLKIYLPILFLAAGILGIFIYNKGSQTIISYNIPCLMQNEVPNLSEDIILSEYMREVLPENISRMDSELKVSYSVSANKHHWKENSIEKHIVPRKYTFQYYDYQQNENVYHTVIDLYFSDQIKISKKAHMEIYVCEKLYSVRPLNVKIFTWDEIDQTWENTIETQGSVSGQILSVYEQQIKVGKGQHRILMDFKSYENPSAESGIEYTLKFLDC